MRYWTGTYLAQGDERVLGSVMVVNVQVAFGAHPQTPARVFGHCVDHVVEEADASVDVDDLGL